MTGADRAQKIHANFMADEKPTFSTAFHPKAAVKLIRCRGAADDPRRTYAVRSTVRILVVDSRNTFAMRGISERPIGFL